MMKFGRKILSIIICFAILLGISASGGEGLADVLDLLRIEANAETVSGTYGNNITWKLNKDTGLLIISGTGCVGLTDYSDYLNSMNSSYPWFTQEEHINSLIDYSDCDDYIIKEIIIEEGVTGIGWCAFGCCGALTSVSIPSTVTDFYPMALSRCPRLASIKVAEDNPRYHSSGNCLIETQTKTLLAGCNESIIPIDGSVTSIGEVSFFGTGPCDLFIPDTITSIDRNAFYFHQTDNNINVTVSRDNPVYHSAGNCIIETSTKTLIAGFPNSVIPDDGSVVRLGDRAFTSVLLSGFKLKIPSTITAIGEYSLYNCESFYIFIPDSLDAVINRDRYDYFLFFEGSEEKWSTLYHSEHYSNPQLRIYNYKENGLIEADNSLEYEIQNNEAKITGCNKDVSGILNIPSEIEGYPVTEISYNAFYMCYGISELILPETLKRIDIRAFAGCVGLRKINIPQNVEYIGALAFMDCTNLEEIELSSENSFYHSEGNCIIENETKKLIAAYYYPIIPDDGSVEIIDFGAFSCCIYPYYLSIPKSVKSMGSSLFLHPNWQIRCICFEGTTEEWNSIERFTPDIYFRDAGYNYGNNYDDYSNYYDNNDTLNYNEFRRSVCLGDIPDHIHEYRHYGIKAATCTQDGFEIIACPYCGDRYNRVIPALGHDLIHREATPSTCCTPGNEAYDYCSRRDYSTLSGLIPANGNHSWKYSTDKHTITASCENCDESFSVTAVLPENLICSGTPKAITLEGDVPKGFVTNISYDTEDGQAPKKAGKYNAHGYLMPDDLSDVILASVDVELNIEHNLTNHEGKAPTCTEDGYEPYEDCSYCGYSTYKLNPSSGHNYVASYEWSDDGKSCYASAVCSNNSSHTFGEYGTITSKVKIKPTCTQMGVTTYTASFGNRFFYTQTKDVEDIPALEHDYSVNYEWSADGKACTATAVCANDASHTFSENGSISSSVKVKPTCTEEGITTYTAAFNNKFFYGQSKDIEDIPALGHSFTNYIYNNDATTERDGTETAKCDRCDETDTRVKPGTMIVIPVNPTANAKINVANEVTIDYRTKVKISATATNLDTAYHLVMIVNGKTVNGDNKEVTYDHGELKGDLTYSVKIVDAGGKVQKDADGKDLVKDGGKITCNAGFIQRLVAFFKGLFNSLPEKTVRP